MHLLSFLLTATLVNSACKSSVTCSLPWSPTMCSGYDVGSKVCYLADFDLHHYEYSCYDTAKCRNPSLAPSDPSSGWSQIDMCEGECSFPLCPSDIEAVGSGTWSHVPLNIHCEDNVAFTANANTGFYVSDITVNDNSLFTGDVTTQTGDVSYIAGPATKIMLTFLKVDGTCEVVVATEGKGQVKVIPASPQCGTNAVIECSADDGYLTADITKDGELISDGGLPHFTITTAVVKNPTMVKVQFNKTCEVQFKALDSDAAISRGGPNGCGSVTNFHVGQDPSGQPHRYLDYVTVNGKIILKDTCTLVGDYKIYHQVPTDPTMVTAQFIIDPTSSVKIDCIHCDGGVSTVTPVQEVYMCTDSITVNSVANAGFYVAAIYHNGEEIYEGVETSVSKSIHLWHGENELIAHYKTI